MSRVSRRALPALCLAVITALASGCEIAQITVEQPESRIVAEVYLRVHDGESDAVALLHQTPGENGVSLLDAEVRVRDLDGGQEGRFSPVPLPVCIEGLVPLELDAQCLALDAAAVFELRPGGRYLVTIELEGGKRLEGTVTLPGDFELVVPAQGVPRCRLRPNELLRIRWTPSAGARAYVPEAAVFGLDAAFEPEGIVVPTNPLTLQGLSISEADTDIVFPSQFGIFNRFSADGDVLVALQRGLPAASVVQGVIVVSAQGRNAVNWNRGGNFNPSGTVRIPSLFGDGTGVVGGIVNRSFSFTSGEQPGVPPCAQPG
ncbi:MAG: hypothetical protein EA350_04900 [Gemmatimonadales bacterium]|nr:MAG: hypothetical protein EA350_04900 [Gemmatimonadales bacterium]